MISGSRLSARPRGPSRSVPSRRPAPLAQAIPSPTLTSSLLMARMIAFQHLRPGQQVVSEGDGHGDLQVREPGQDGVGLLFCEIGRILSHLLNVTTQAMDVGALTPPLWGFEEREKLMVFYERAPRVIMHRSTKSGRL